MKFQPSDIVKITNGVNHTLAIFEYYLTGSFNEPTDCSVRIGNSHFIYDDSFLELVERGEKVPDIYTKKCDKCSHTVQSSSPITQYNCGCSVESGGVKYDEGKPDFTYISYELLEEIAKVRAFGAKKYEKDNWKKGFKITRSLAAALRHIFLFLTGETNDSESGHSHLAHAVCCLEHAIFDMKHHPENDDRSIKK